MMICLQSRTLCYCIVPALCLVWISSVSGSYQCSCYTFSWRSKKWWYGKGDCTTQKGDLVSMETVEEWEFIKTQIQNKTVYGNEWWIGLEKRGGGWEWTSGYPLTYDKWQPHEPSNRQYEMCVKMAKNYPKNTYGLFEDDKCNVPRGWICEYKGKACSGHQVRWCNQTSTTTRMTPRHVTKRPMVKTATNTPYINKPTQHRSIAHQQNTTPLQAHHITKRPMVKRATSTPYINNNKPTRHMSIIRKKSDLTTPDYPKLVVANTDCIPYPLLVTAIFVCVLGGLTALGAVAFFLIPYLLKKRRSSID